MTAADYNLIRGDKAPRLLKPTDELTAFDPIANKDVRVLPSASVAGSGAAGVTVTENVGAINRSTIPLSSVSVTMTDATTSGCHGSYQAYTFPAGLILVLGVVTDLTLLAGAGGIADGAALVASVGSATVGTNNATLTTTEADMVPSTACTLSSGAGTFKGESTAVCFIDGTGTAGKVYVNLAVPDADSSASDTITVSGSIVVSWVALGDN